MKFHTKYDPPVVEGIKTSPVSTVQQHFKDDCDINILVERFTRTGQLQQRDPEDYSFGDFSAVDYQSALDTILLANEQFGTLPATVRERFSNNPAQLLHFLEQESNREEAVRLGLIASESVGTVSSLDVTVPTDTKEAESEVQ